MPDRATSPSPADDFRRAFARFAAAVSALIAAVGLAGWTLGLPVMRSVLPGAVEMKASTAVGLLAAAAALWVTTGPPRRWRPAVCTGLAAGVAALGAFALGGWLVGGLRGSGVPVQLLPSPYAALSFVALGLALVVLPRGPGARTVQAGGGVAAGLGLVTLVGYAWNVGGLVTDRVTTPIALNTATALLLLGVSTFLLGMPRPTGGVRDPRLRLERLVLAGVAPAMLLIVVGGGLSYRSGDDFARTAALIAHTQEVRAELGRLRTATTDAELAARNALVLPGAGFEAVQAAMMNEARERVAVVRRLVADNADQRARAMALDELVWQHVGELEALASADPLDRAVLRERMVAHVRSDNDRRMRDLVRAMDEAEAALLAQRLARAADARATTLKMLLATAGLSALLFGLLFRSIRQEARARRSAQEHLLRLNADLEAARGEAEGASRAKSAFLANMSHEIRTPMNAIIGLTFLMLRETRDAVQRDRLGKVGDAAQHLLKLISDILDMSKIEAGKMGLQQMEFGLDGLMSSATEMVTGKARDKGLELILDTGDLPPRLVGDPTRLSQILINLLSNAVKFTEHGWVRLRCRILSEPRVRCSCASRCRTPAPASRRSSRRRCSSPSSRPTGRSRASTAAPGSGSRCRASSPRQWAGRPASSAPPAPAAPSG